LKAVGSLIGREYGPKSSKESSQHCRSLVIKLLVATVACFIGSLDGFKVAENVSPEVSSQLILEVKEEIDSPLLLFTGAFQRDYASSVASTHPIVLDYDSFW